MGNERRKERRKGDRIRNVKGESSREGNTSKEKDREIKRKKYRGERNRLKVRDQTE